MLLTLSIPDSVSSSSAVTFTLSFPDSDSSALAENGVIPNTMLALKSTARPLFMLHIPFVIDYLLSTNFIVILVF